MKHLFTLSLLLMAGFVYGQIETPAASPFSKVEQTIGLTTVTVEYSRPGVKGRKVFAADGLVPYGKLWRTGANAVTKITFSDDVTVNDQALAAGEYAVLTKPGATTWKVHFYPYEGRSWGSYVEKETALAVTALPQPAPWTIETFTMSFQDLETESANLMLGWENTVVSLIIGVEVDERVMNNIDQVLGGPTNSDFYSAAYYYHTSGKDLNKAYEWIEKATSVPNPKFWQVRRKAMILADMGKKKEAIQAAEMSMKLAEEAGNEEYVKMNKASIAEWSK